MYERHLPVNLFPLLNSLSIRKEKSQVRTTIGTIDNTQQILLPVIIVLVRQLPIIFQRSIQSTKVHSTELNVFHLALTIDRLVCVDLLIFIVKCVVHCLG